VQNTNPFIFYVSYQTGSWYSNSINSPHSPIATAGKGAVCSSG